MSGRKVSEFRLQQEQQDRFRLVQAIANTHAEARGLKEHVTATLQGVSPGLRSTFQREVREAESWLKTAVPETASLGMSSNLTDLRSAQNQWERVTTQGRRTLETLVSALTQKAGALGKRLAGDLAQTEQVYLSRQDLLGAWFGQVKTSRWAQSLQDIHQQVKQERYAEAERALPALREEIAEQGRRAAEREEQFLKRDYLLKALRRVCADMRFKELSVEEGMPPGPQPQDANDRGSPILYSVDTRTRGKIFFTLALDSVHSFSRTEDDHCFEELDVLSEFLREKYGVETCFESEEGKERPQDDSDVQKKEPRSGGWSAGKS